MKLRALQSAVQNFVLRLDEGVAPQIQDGGALTVNGRLEIYAEAYRLRLVEVLGHQYPALNAWMGGEAFDRMAIAYIDAKRSRNFSVRWFGDGLCDFIHHCDAYKEHPVLEEMARFEWALACAFDAADLTPVSYEELTEVPAPQWPSLVFSFHPGLGRVDCRWNTVDVWQALTGGRKPPAAEQSAVPQSWLVWRSGLATRFRALSVVEARVLEYARGGASFADQCALLARDMADARAAAELAALLGVWVRDGIITGMSNTPATE